MACFLRHNLRLQMIHWHMAWMWNLSRLRWLNLWSVLLDGMLRAARWHLESDQIKIAKMLASLGMKPISFCSAMIHGEPQRFAGEFRVKIKHRKFVNGTLGYWMSHAGTQREFHQQLNGKRLRPSCVLICITMIHRFKTLHNFDKVLISSSWFAHFSHLVISR